MNGKIEFIRPLHFSSKGRAADSLLIITVRASVDLWLITL